jgi:hypothetical protein
MNTQGHCCRVVAVLALFLLSFYVTASAYRDDYLNETIVYRTVDRGTTEFENWFDLEQPHSESKFFRYDLALEHGVTEHFMLGALIAFDTARDGFNYGRSRLEARYRFGEENLHGISVATSLEFEDDQLERSDDLIARVVLNRDFKDFNVALNLLPQVELRGHQGHAFGYAIGLRYGQKELVRYGLEIQENVSERCIGQVIPQLWIRLPYSLDLKIGYAQRFTTGADNFFRIIVETEFGERGER